MSRSTAATTTNRYKQQLGSTSSITQKTSRQSRDDDSSGDDDDDVEDLYLIGTPIDPDEQQYKQQRGEARQQRSDQQRQHPRFDQPVSETNTFIPSTFVSSRSKRANPNVNTVSDYMDVQDEDEDLKAAIGVSADIERPTATTKSTTADAFQQMIIPKHESVAARLLRQMGWREGVGIGPRLSSATTTSQTSTKPSKRKQHTAQVPKRKVYTAALPPSLQAIDEEAAAEESLDEDDGEENSNADVDADLSSSLSQLSVPDLPVIVPIPKSDTAGLDFDPLLYAEEFQQYQQRKQQPKQSISHHYRPSAPNSRSSALVVDEDEEEVMEIWSMRTKNNNNRIAKNRDHKQRFPGFLIDAATEDADDEIELYGDKEDYDSEIGLLKGEGKETQQRREKADKERTEMIHRMEQPLTFVAAAILPPPPPLSSSIIVPEGYDGMHHFTDEEEQPISGQQNEAEEGKINTNSNPKQLLRDYALRMRKQLQQQQQQESNRKATEEQQQEEQQKQKQEGESAAATSSSSKTRTFSSSPVPSLLSSSWSQLTASASLSDKFQEASTSASSSSSSAASASSPALVPDLPTLTPLHPHLFDKGTSYAIAAEMGLFGPRTREILHWRPEPLLCRRLGLPQPNHSLTTLKESSQSNTSDRELQSQPQQGKQQQQSSSFKSISENSEPLHPPASFTSLTDRPPVSLFKAIFEDNSEMSVSSDTWRLLSSITLPDSIPTSSAAPSTPESSTTTTTAPVLPSFVHPSRQHLVSTTAQANSSPLSRVGPTAPVNPANKKSRWGAPVAGPIAAVTANPLRPPYSLSSTAATESSAPDDPELVVLSSSVVQPAQNLDSLRPPSDLVFDATIKHEGIPSGSSSAASSLLPSASSSITSSLVFSSSLLSPLLQQQLLKELEKPIKAEKKDDNSSGHKHKKKKEKKKHKNKKDEKSRERKRHRDRHSSHSHPQRDQAVDSSASSDSDSSAVPFVDLTVDQ